MTPLTNVLAFFRLWVARASGVVRRARSGADLAAEWHAHLEMEADALMQGGVAPAEAWRRARLHAGSIDAATEAYRDQTGIPIVERAARAVRHAMRGLLRNPSYAAAVILSLALGLGVTTAIVGIADAVLRRPLPFDHASDLLSIGQTLESAKGPSDSTQITTWTFYGRENITAWRDGSRLLAGVATYSSTSAAVQGDAAPEYVEGAEASPSLLEVVGTRPARGRWFGSDELRGRVVVLSDALWRAQFGADTAVVGRTLRIRDEPWTVIGVMGAGGGLPRQAQFWMPSGDQEGQIVARARPGVAPAQLARELEGLSPTIENRRRRGDRSEIVIAPLQDQLVGHARAPLQLLFAAAALLLLIACANVGSLALARVLDRRRELAVRATLGASRRALAGLLLAEQCLLGLGGALLACLLAVGTVRIAAAVAPIEVRQLASFQITRAALAFNGVAAFVAAMVIGLGAAAIATRLPLSASLAAGGVRAGRGRESLRIRRALVATQLALALLLLTGTGLLIRSVDRLTRIGHLGFTPDHVTIASLELTSPRYHADAERGRVVQQLLERMRVVPGVEHVALGPPPLVGGRGEGLREGFNSLIGTATGMVWVKKVDAEYLPTYGFRLVAGRWFLPSDGAGTPDVAVVNRAAARAFFPDGLSPVGRTIAHRVLAREGKPSILVVGVVEDALQRDVAMEANAELLMLASQTTEVTSVPTIAVRGSAAPAAIVAQMRAAILAADPSLAAVRLQTMSSVMRESVAPYTFLLAVLGSFAVLAVSLAGIGLYAVVSYLVAQRTHEIGVRLALGARITQVYTLVMREGALLALIGVGAGVPAGLALTRFLRAYLFQVAPSDLTTFLIAPSILGTIALIATVLPARRAARTDPARALRDE